VICHSAFYRTVKLDCHFHQRMDSANCEKVQTMHLLARATPPPCP
jgi:hypothetical protein